MKKILIVGCPVSGKTYLAKELAKHLNCPHKELDDIFWAKKFSKKASEKKRDEKRDSFLAKHKTWVVEGAYAGNWAHAFYEKADTIIFLKMPQRTLRSRLIFKRYLKKKKNLFSLTGWKRIQRILANKPIITSNIETVLKKPKLTKKVITLNSQKEVSQFLKNQTDNKT